MIQLVWEQVSKAKLADKIIVATDDKRIFNAVKNFGGNVVMTSKKHKSGSDRVAVAASKKNYDIVVNVQGDEPFIKPNAIDSAIRALIKDKSVQVSTLAVKIKDKSDIKDESVVKVTLDSKNFAQRFSRSIKSDKSDQSDESDKSLYKHIGLYVYRKSYLMEFVKLPQSSREKKEKLEQLRILENGDKIKVVITKYDSLSIDTKEDLKKVK